MLGITMNGDSEHLRGKVWGEAPYLPPPILCASQVWALPSPPPEGRGEIGKQTHPGTQIKRVNYRWGQRPHL